MLYFNIIDKNKINIDFDKLSLFINNLCTSYKMSIQLIQYNFCSEKEIKKINKDRLNHSYVTDVICFNYTKDKIMNADIYVCPSFIKTNALIYNISFEFELHRVLFHSILHILGYDDKLYLNQYIMRKKENLLINKYFYENKKRK